MRKLSTFVLSFFAISAFAQVGINTPWIWMKGSNQIASYGNYGTMGVEHPANEPFSRSAGTTFVDLQGNLWLFGGMTWLPAPMFWYFNDLWKFNTSTNNWTWIKGSDLTNVSGAYGTMGVPSFSNNPGGRERSASWTDKDGNFWMFGGEGFDRLGNYGTMNDLWMYDVSDNTWVWVKGSDLENDPGVYGIQGVPAPANRPSARSWPVSWADNDGYLWLFGGHDQNYFSLNDLWRYNIRDNEWTWMKGSPAANPAAMYGNIGVSSPLNTPGGKAGATGWSSNNDLYLLGGTNSSFTQVQNDLWKYTTSNNQWTWISGSNTIDPPPFQGTAGVPASANQPGGRFGAVSFKDLSGNFWLFGGYGLTTSPSGKEVLNDLWRYSPLTNEWAWMKGGEFNASGVYGNQGVPSVTNKPGGRSLSMSWSDQAGNFWLFGGWGNDGTGLRSELNDLWKISSMALLPVKLVSFTGVVLSHDIRLQWEAEEMNNTSVFIVQRSIDGVHFVNAGTVTAIIGRKHYQFNDPLVNLKGPHVYYRLKMTDQDNSYAYSKVLSFRFTKSSVDVFPNPASTQIQFALSGSGNTTYSIIDIKGRIVLHGKISATGFTASVNVLSLSRGSYKLITISSDGIKQGEFVKL